MWFKTKAVILKLKRNNSEAGGVVKRWRGRGGGH